jgi:hypothetical protein
MTSYSHKLGLLCSLCLARLAGRSTKYVTEMTTSPLSRSLHFSNQRTTCTPKPFHRSTPPQLRETSGLNCQGRSREASPYLLASKEASSGSPDSGVNRAVVAAGARAALVVTTTRDAGSRAGDGRGRGARREPDGTRPASPSARWEIPSPRHDRGVAMTGVCRSSFTLKRHRARPSERRSPAR